MNPIQVFIFLHVSMSSALFDLMIDNLVDTKLFRLIIFHIFVICSFVCFDIGFGTSFINFRFCDIRFTFFFCFVTLSSSRYFSSPLFQATLSFFLTSSFDFFAVNLIGWSILRTSFSVFAWGQGRIEIGIRFWQTGPSFWLQPRYHSP